MAPISEHITEILSLALATLAGFVIAGTALFLFWKRQSAAEKTRHREDISLLRRESDLAAREFRAQLELESRERQTRLEKEVHQREVELAHAEEKSRSGQAALQAQTAELSRRALDISRQGREINTLQEKLHQLQQEYVERLQELSGLSLSSIKEELLQEACRDCEDEIRKLKKEMLATGEGEVRSEARRILIDCMQRIASTPMQDITATIVPLPSEAMKGRLIGREGRNIKAFESATGTTLLIDETPDSVLISSFDPVRREIARIALEQLMRDGRIHPASIEEAVAQATEELKSDVMAAGEDALRQAKLSHMHPEIVALLGKLRFRLSNNQNSLDHSIEAANLCSLMAAELGLDPEIARRTGLLHDIGKSIEGDYEGSHAIAGANVLKRCGEDPRVVNAVAAHHNEIDHESPYVSLLMIADSLSAARPGARSENLDSYIQRVSVLEKLALEQKGVVEAYAIQAGREIRVIVSPDDTTDDDARFVARNIRSRIEDELQYPGSIKVTVIREKRFTEQAK